MIQTVFEVAIDGFEHLKSKQNILVKRAKKKNIHSLSQQCHSKASTNNKINTTPTLAMSSIGHI